MAALEALPNELLSLIVRHLARPTDLLHLALCNRRLCQYVRLDGWKALLKGLYGLIGQDQCAASAVHGLSRLERSWQRRAFDARYVYAGDPTSRITSLNTWQPEEWCLGQSQQSIGYTPQIDSYEELSGGWVERREVLTWAAGTQIMLRVKHTGRQAARRRSQQHDETRAPWTSDDYGHISDWHIYHVPGTIEGPDDITSLGLFRPHQNRGDCDRIIYSNASGRLASLSLNMKEHWSRDDQYDTARREVDKMCLSSATEPLVAALLEDTTIALYATNHQEQLETPLAPLDEARPVTGASRAHRNRSCIFLGHDKVVIGVGRSGTPLQVHSVSPSGIVDVPLRFFEMDGQHRGGAETNFDTVDAVDVASMVPVPADLNGGFSRDIFLSGAYDGFVRLHDMRSPRGFDSLFWDVTNDAYIYSLACQGPNRFVAGSAMHSMVKVFDLRVSGARPCDARRVQSPTQMKQNGTSSGRSNQPHSLITGGWNLFLSPRLAERHPAGQRTVNSPVYSLSIPSATCANLYAGLEGDVKCLTFTSVADPLPDPVLTPYIPAHPFTAPDRLCLGMYEQGNQDKIDMQLIKQDFFWGHPIDYEKRTAFAEARGIDERWMDPNEESERWSRGQSPSRIHKPRYTWGRGRGRARTRGRGHTHSRGRAA